MPEPTLPAVDIAAPTETTPKLNPAVEAQAIEQYIKDSGRFLETARSHTTIVETLAAHGFDDEELSIGMALQAEANRMFRARHEDLPPDRGAATEALMSRVNEARDEFEAYRIIARTVFPALADRVALRATSDALDDLQRFINAAHAGYVAAMQEPYTPRMSKRGYPPAKLEKLLGEIDVLATLDVAQEIAEGDGAGDGGDGGGAFASTEERDRTYTELKEFMKEIKGVSKAIFRKQPEVLALLEL